MKMFDTNGKGFYEIPNYISGGTQTTVTIGVITVLLIIFIIGVIIVIGSGKKRIKSLEDGKIKGKGKVENQLEKSRIKTNNMIIIVAMLVILILPTYFGLMKYDNYLMGQRGYYADESIEKINTSPKVTEKISKIDILDKKENATTDRILEGGTVDNLGNKYYGMYDMSHSDIYEVRIETETGEKKEVEAKIMAVYDEKDYNVVEYREGEKGEILNSKVYLSESKVKDVRNESYNKESKE